MCLHQHGHTAMNNAYFHADVYFPNNHREILYSQSAPTKLGVLRKIGTECYARIYRVTGGRRKLVEIRKG